MIVFQSTFVEDCLLLNKAFHASIHLTTLDTTLFKVNVSEMSQPASLELYGVTFS